MADYPIFEHDVIVIGAGGAGLRAAIEASAAGVSVGLICKSLLGKAHTVMAEGGMAAAMGNVDDRDNWKVHFSDTMRGGQYINNWRMAEIHAKEAPDRVRELEAWGAVFDRTPDGRILQRNFGGHRYPRLAHVGDRTGLELIRTLQDHGVHQGIEVYMEVTVVSLLKDGDRVVGCLAYEREHGRFRVFKCKALVLATGGVGRAYKITSNSWEGTGDGHALAYEAGAEYEATLTEEVAWALLKRYGVVFKRLLEREGMALPWRVLLRFYHRLEARGDIRGGRFVAGISGEQFALPEAIGMLRAIRRAGAQESLISVSAADPLNLVGIIVPGSRITAHTSNRILYHDGAPIAALESGETRFLVELSRTMEWKAKAALVRKATRPELRSYLQRPA
jgi:hypothetical protein